MLAIAWAKDIFSIQLPLMFLSATRPLCSRPYAKKFHTGPGWYFPDRKKEDIDHYPQKMAWPDAG